jgi:hypothetical protein
VGANTFGAIVNGEIWSFDLKDSDFSGGASLPLNELLTVSAGFFTKERNEGIGFVIGTEFIKDSTYILNNQNKNEHFLYTKTGEIRCIYNPNVNENTVYSGIVEITNINKERKIISGRFEFEIFIDGEPREGSNVCGIIKVESGRFDLKYNN